MHASSSWRACWSPLPKTYFVSFSEATGGKVVDVSLPRDRTTGRPRGFGFVTFSTPEEAVGARQSLDGLPQAGRAWCDRSSEPPRRVEGGPPGRAEGGGGGRGRIAPSTSAIFRTTSRSPRFSSFSRTTRRARSCAYTVPAGPDGRLRGFGFVTLASAEAANAAIVALRSVDVRGRRLKRSTSPTRKGAPGSQGDRPRSTAPRPRRRRGRRRLGPRSSLSVKLLPDPDAARGTDSRRAKSGEEESEEEARTARRTRSAAAAVAGEAEAPVPREKVDKKAGGNWKSWQNWDDDDKQAGDSS